jgi:hypothetical protein
MFPKNVFFFVINQLHETNIWVIPDSAISKSCSESAGNLRDA